MHILEREPVMILALLQVVAALVMGNENWSAASAVAAGLLARSKVSPA